MEKTLSEGERRNRKQLLDMLKVEEAVVSTKGFRGSARSRTLYFEPFKDSITCLNFGRETLEPCDQCWLMEFVPRDYHENALPCHQIPMNHAGETVVSLECRGDIIRLEQTVLAWLRSKIAQLERELSEDAGRPSDPVA
jgi:hypothetical protein